MPLTKAPHNRTRRSDSCLLAHERLLRICTTARLHDKLHSHLDAVLSDPALDWTAVVMQSIRHGVSSLVALHLKAFQNDPRIPLQVEHCFARMYEGNRERNAVLYRETASLLRKLEDAGIRCFVLKGVALSLTVYPDTAIRNFADIDILVDPEQMELAAQIATRCGFQSEALAPDVTAHHTKHLGFCAEDILTETLAPEFDHTITPEILERYRHQVVVEIHRGLFRLPSGHLREVDMTEFWKHPQTARLPDGTTMSFLSPEAMIVHLATHAADHIFRRLLFPVDIILVLQSYAHRISWERVGMLADLTEMRAEVYRMLEFVHREFGAEIPAETLKQLCPQGKCTPLHWEDVFCAMQTNQSAQTFQLLSRTSNFREGIASVGHLIFPPLASMRRIYGITSPLLLLPFYVLRPFHLAARLISVLYRQAHPTNRMLPPKEEGYRPPLFARGKK